MLKQKQNKKHEHEHQSKKEREMQLPYSIRLHQASNNQQERSVRSEVRGLYIYIYIYTLYKRKVHQTLRNARRQRDMVFCLFPVPCLSVCLQTFCRHSADIHVSAETACRKTLLGTYLVGWYLRVGKGKGKGPFFVFFWRRGYI